MIITASSNWRERRRGRGETVWQTRGNKERRRWRRKQTTKQDRRRGQRKTGGGGVYYLIHTENCNTMVPTIRTVNSS